MKFNKLIFFCDAIAGEIFADCKEIQDIQSVSVGEIRHTSKLLCSTPMRKPFESRRHFDLAGCMNCSSCISGPSASTYQIGSVFSSLAYTTLHICKIAQIPLQKVGICMRTLKTTVIYIQSAAKEPKLLHRYRRQ